MPPSASSPDLLWPALEEAEKRPIRLSKIPVISNTAPKATGPSTFGATGTLTVFVGKKGSGAIDQVRAAIAGGNPATTKLRDRLQKQYSKLPPGSSETLVQQIVKATVFADIRYGGATLNSGVFVPKGVDVAVIVLPYNGGRLAPEGFTLAERYKDGSDAALEAVVMQAAPNLSAAEKTALQAVPANQVALNVGQAIDCRTTWWAVAQMAVVQAEVRAAVIAASLVVGPFCPLSKEVHISVAQIKALGPAASARKLLDLRRRVLLGGGAR